MPIYKLGPEASNYLKHYDEDIAVLGSTGRNRDRYDIMADVIRAVKNGKKKKTQIMQTANLNADQVNKYLHLCVARRCLIEEESSE